MKKVLGADGSTVSGPVVWQLANGAIRPIQVTVGASDGVQTEIGSAELVEGTRVVTRVADSQPSASDRPAASPLLAGGRGR